jgi:hypothetical protein
VYGKSPLAMARCMVAVVKFLIPQVTIMETSLESALCYRATKSHDMWLLNQIMVSHTRVQCPGRRNNKLQWSEVYCCYISERLSMLSERNKVSLDILLIHVYRRFRLNNTENRYAESGRNKCCLGYTIGHSGMGVV